MRFSAVCATTLFMLLPASTRARAADSGITLDSRATILVDSGQPGPVQRAAEDLASDMEKVFGQKPRIVSTAEDAGAVTIVLGHEATGAPADHDAAPEAFSITTGTATLGGGRKAEVIRLAGSDMRGTIYAIYQFSQEYLGVDRTRELVEDFAGYLKNPDTAIPPPLEWRNWEAYYHIQHYEGTRTVDVH